MNEYKIIRGLLLIIIGINAYFNIRTLVGFIIGWAIMDIIFGVIENANNKR